MLFLLDLNLLYSALVDPVLHLLDLQTYANHFVRRSIDFCKSAIDSFVVKSYIFDFVSLNHLNMLAVLLLIYLLQQNAKCFLNLFGINDLHQVILLCFAAAAAAISPCLLFSIASRAAFC